ncbi:MBL fold metallo-hydrolase [Candidatus Woesearchaeota archaeon]|nr:MBL fold metallo-hydrolase [Candidatus Woesearchaeota archaeon]
MKIKYWGTRGSVATPSTGDFSTLKYGGNTSCVEIETANGELIVLDAGSGLRLLGQNLMANGFLDSDRSVKLLVGHVHPDHVEGLSFFAPAFIAGTKINIVSGELEKPLEEILRGKYEKPKFPISIDQMSADFSFYQLREGESLENGVAISHCLSKHPDLCYAFKIQEETESGIVTFCYVLDNEHDGDPSKNSFGVEDKRIIKFMTGADYVLIDSAYTPQEHDPARFGLSTMTKKGWGHATYESNIQRAIAAGVKNLVLAHHDPSHDDVFLAVMERDARQYLQQLGVDKFLQVSVAREGVEEYLH